MGYAFKEQLKKSLGKAAISGSLSLTDRDDEEEKLPVGRLKFWGKNNVEKKMEVKIEDGTWVFLGGQQGLSDAIHFMSSSHI